MKSLAKTLTQRPLKHRWSGLAGQANTKCKLASGVIGATGQHQCVDAAGLRLGDDGRPAIGMGTIAAQKPGRPRHLHAAHADRTLVEVHLQHLRGGVVQRTNGFHEVG